MHESLAAQAAHDVVPVRGEQGDLWLKTSYTTRAPPDLESAVLHEMNFWLELLED